MKVVYHPKVNKFIRNLARKESARIIRVVELFEESGFELTEKHLKKITKNLWELKAGRWRLFFGKYDNVARVVNIILKSTQKTPKREIDLALKRLEEIK